ncbi:MAG: hypothetical protein IPG43_03220 [Proteobacteria bacterium]|nr:hypothetical protein [Pseudomonadota bacterium]
MDLSSGFLKVIVFLAVLLILFALLRQKAQLNAMLVDFIYVFCDLGAE